MERGIPSNGSPISIENASQEDVRKEVEVVVYGHLKKQEYLYQPKAGKKRKELVLPKTI